MTEALTPAVGTALIASGLYLLVGQLTGVWKYLHIRQNPSRGAPRYVNVSHQAALMYSFAALVLAALAHVSAWTDTTNLIAVVAPVTFFGLAIGGYVIHGYLQDTHNQFAKPHVLGKLTIPSAAFSGFMVALVIAEIGGSAVLLAGAIKTVCGF